MTKITLETQYGSYSIETVQDNLNIEQMRDDLLSPLLLAAGFHWRNVDELFFDKEGETSGNRD